MKIYQLNEIYHITDEPHFKIELDAKEFAHLVYRYLYHTEYDDYYHTADGPDTDKEMQEYIEEWCRENKYDPEEACYAWNDEGYVEENADENP